MREIKFRAWDKKEKAMASVENLNFEFNMANLHFSHDYFKDNIDLNEVELMQYTGLKDCKGVEIYEGDIVRLCGDLKMIYGNFDYYSIISEVIFNNDTISFDAPRIAPPLNKNNCIYFEVIGNIYENSELLGGENE